MTVSVSCDADLAKVKAVLNDIISKEQRILPEPASQVIVAEPGDRSVNFVMRVCTRTSVYWPVKFDATGTIKNRYDTKGIGMPFPQRDVHIVSGAQAA